MGISISAAINQAEKLENTADGLQKVANSLITIKSDVNIAWKAQEVWRVNSVIESYIADIKRLSTDLQSLKSDIINTAYDIKREEEERERAEAEARAREEAERAERVKVMERYEK
ncbi:hypothetical protein [Aquibacillus kalidii]|uniref:hypothetical protein n=1 Tax=Aquibacillus kalidii TaxID=2762597 RepID=UPI0016480B80|nr:hypothetical protein [Aquibacillus kalidii]